MEAQLEDVGSGLAPVSEGWFVVNVPEAAWLTNAAFGARCVFEADARVLRARADLTERRFLDLWHYPCRPRTGSAERALPCRVGTRSFSGACRRMHGDRRRGGEAPAAMGSAALPRGDRSCLHRCRRWAVRALHGRRAHARKEHRLSAQRSCSASRGGRGERDALAAGGVWTVPALAARQTDFPRRVAMGS
jgi:hypothetical protein